MRTVNNIRMYIYIYMYMFISRLRPCPWGPMDQACEQVLSTCNKQDVVDIQSPDHLNGTRQTVSFVVGTSYLCIFCSLSLSLYIYIINIYMYRYRYTLGFCKLALSGLRLSVEWWSWPTRLEGALRPDRAPRLQNRILGRAHGPRALHRP